MGNRRRHTRALSGRDETKRTMGLAELGRCGLPEASKTVVSAIRHILRGSVYLSGDASTHLLHRLGSRGTASIPSTKSTVRHSRNQMVVLLGFGFRVSGLAGMASPVSRMMVWEQTAVHEERERHEPLYSEVRGADQWNAFGI